MKIFGFYFIVNLIFSLLVLSLGLDDTFQFLRYPLNDIVLTCAFFCAVLQFLSVLQMVNFTGERNWVRAMFVLLPASAFFLLVYTALSRYYQEWINGEIPSFWVGTVLVLSGLGFLLFVVGGFFVRSKRLARGLRIWIFFMVVVIGLFMATTIYQKYIVKNNLFNYLLTFEFGVLFVPLLPLQYRLWRRDPHLERLEAEAMAIGEPENSST